MTDVVQKLWGFCNTLRHDGINYGDYIEQLTYLLFLKLADEKGVPVPDGFGWTRALGLSGHDPAAHGSSRDARARRARPPGGRPPRGPCSRSTPPSRRAPGSTSPRGRPFGPSSAASALISARPGLFDPRSRRRPGRPPD